MHHHLIFYLAFILSLSVLVSVAHANNEIASFDSVSFPALNANFFKPVQVKNYVFVAPLDSPMMDFCAIPSNFTSLEQNSTLKLWVSKGTRNKFPTVNMMELDCMKYFCTLSNETTVYQHYNMTQRLVKDESYR